MGFYFSIFVIASIFWWSSQLGLNAKHVQNNRFMVTNFEKSQNGVIIFHQIIILFLGTIIP
jgi:hypothetical protein